MTLFKTLFIYPVHYIYKKMNRLNRVGQIGHSFQGEALFRQRREKGATPRQKFIRENLVSEVAKNRVNRVSPGRRKT